MGVLNLSGFKVNRAIVRMDIINFSKHVDSMSISIYLRVKNARRAFIF